MSTLLRKLLGLKTKGTLLTSRRSTSDRQYEVTDDSGFLAFVDPDAYEGFVDSDWSLEQLFDHFREQMAKRTLLIWGTGVEEIWHVIVRTESSGASGFRSVSGGIESSSGRLLLTNYESLTMAAQFADVKLPERHQADNIITVAPGRYDCRITQLEDPNSDDERITDKADWIIELQHVENLTPVWPEVPWSPV